MKQDDDTRANCVPGITIAISLLRYLKLTLGNEMSVTKICGRPSRLGHGGSRELKAIAPWVIIRQCQLPTYPRRATMTSNSDEIVQQVQQAFQALVAYVTGAEARGRPPIPWS
jgi:hypothetical protein